MSKKTLEQKIQEVGNPAHMLRNVPTGLYAFPYPPWYTTWREEQEAWNNTSLLFDQSLHMTDVYFQGPDVKRLLSDTGVNSLATFGRNRARQFISVNHDGYVIGDAILFGWEDDKVSLVGTPVVPNWVEFVAKTGNYDVEITRDERAVENVKGRLTYRYEITGHTAMQVLEKAAGEPIERIKFFTMGEFTIAGLPVRALNHTMSIVPGSDMTGLEIFGPAEHGPRIWDALVAAGEEFGLKLGGGIAYASTPAESGWIPSPTAAIYTGEQMKPYREYLSADGFEATASIGGSFASDNIEDYYATPWDLGYGKSVKFDHDFIGRDALEKLAEQPKRQKVWMRWNDEDVQRVQASSLFGGENRAKSLDVPGVYAQSPYDKVLMGDRLVGVSTWNAYTVNLGSWWSIGMVDEAEARDGAEVTVVWGEENGGTAKPSVERHVQTNIRATLKTTAPLT